MRGDKGARKPKSQKVYAFHLQRNRFRAEDEWARSDDLLYVINSLQREIKRSSGERRNYLQQFLACCKSDHKRLSAQRAANKAIKRIRTLARQERRDKKRQNTLESYAPLEGDQRIDMSHLFLDHCQTSLINPLLYVPDDLLSGDHCESSIAEDVKAEKMTATQRKASKREDDEKAERLCLEDRAAKILEEQLKMELAEVGLLERYYEGDD